MHHRAVVKFGTHDSLGYNIQCACGTGGDFGSKEEAMAWMKANHFRYLQGINTAEMVDDTPKPEPTPVPDEPETPLEPTPPEEPKANSA